jgi:CRISPR-associated protein Cas2
MQRLLIVTYDICNPRRLRRVFKTMRGFGQHLQLSVFLCQLTEVERFDMIDALNAEILATEDQVLIVDLGPTTGHVAKIEALGLPLLRDTRGAHIA